MQPGPNINKRRVEASDARAGSRGLGAQAPLGYEVAAEARLAKNLAEQLDSAGLVRDRRSDLCANRFAAWRARSARTPTVRPTGEVGAIPVKEQVSSGRIR